MKDKSNKVEETTLSQISAGEDVFCRAKTGTGKTLAYVLPIGERMLDERERKKARNPRTLVLAPTRELAKQVEREFASTYPSLAVACVYGGAPYQSQREKLKEGTDAVVGTPGRILDLLDRGSLDLQRANQVVIDEGDEMLSKGFKEDVDAIMERTPRERQTLLFSATMPGWVKQLIKRNLNHPRIVDQVGESEDRIAQSVQTMAMICPESGRKSALADVLTVHAGLDKAIVFVRTKAECESIAASLSKRLPAEPLHGDQGQSLREKTLSRFRDGSFTALVATDVAARGLDISDVGLIVHFGLPENGEAFVHRSGRTGRAGRSGKAIALVDPRDRRRLREIAQHSGAHLTIVPCPSAGAFSLPSCPGYLVSQKPRSAEEVAQASANHAQRQIDQVPESVASSFREVAANMVHQSDSVEFLLSRVLAAASGCTKLPAPKSLLTGEEGWQTIKVARDPNARRGPEIRAKGNAINIVQRALDRREKIGRVTLLEEGSNAAAVDLPPDAAQELINAGHDRAIIFEPLRQMSVAL